MTPAVEQSPEVAVGFTLRPILAADLTVMWRLLQEFPLANFDDYGPQNETDFGVEMNRRLKVETITGVEVSSELVGFMAFLPLTERLGTLHGICFSKRVHGTGIPRRAVAGFLLRIIRSGVDKICASYFADNDRVRRFLKKLGASDEGLLKVHTMRKGIPLDMYMVAFYKESR